MSSKKSLTHNKKVIPWSGSWKLWDYVSPAGNNMIAEWLEKDLLDDGRLMFEELLKNIVRVENHLNWVGLRPKPLKQGDERIWELGFSGDGRAYRILGDFCGEKEAVFLLGCYHKQGVYTPADAKDQAFKRKGYLRDGTASHNERTIKIY